MPAVPSAQPQTLPGATMKGQQERARGWLTVTEDCVRFRTGGVQYLLTR